MSMLELKLEWSITFNQLKHFGVSVFEAFITSMS